MKYLEKLKLLDCRRREGIWAERICAELTYLDGISEVDGGAYNDRIEAAADGLLEAIGRDGVITKGAVLHAEEQLSDLIPVAKRYRELFVAHAHIDMNWMWGYNETAAVTVDTFRTILDLMREYPEFTFAQSQASTYEIIEKFRPDMLEEIKERIREGRWEVTAAEWVEPDKNMPDGESMTRQILQTKKYLSHLLDISPDSLCIDFVPDTFGHSVNVPEILSDAGIRYMYHCRGSEGPTIYRYRAPSGKTILNYREYVWYNGEITTNKFEIVPGFCRQEKVNTYLCVYGVGDHGGGPSRRDIERILLYRSWPLTPDIRFGTFRRFFEEIEKTEGIPEVGQELNFLFTGCYTTQSRIKMANRIAEARINEAEALAAGASLLADAPRDQSRLDGAWRNILFNHFHDILPGSGTVETREFAMGRFQETLAAVSTYASRAMYAVAEKIDTDGIAFDTDRGTVSEGGGVGFYQSQDRHYRFPATERGRGAVRVLHLFNTTAYDREEFTEVTVWDYSVPIGEAEMIGADGESLPFRVCETGQGYWGHNFLKLLVKAKLPAFGYTTVILRRKAADGHLKPTYVTYEHCDNFITDAPITVENRLIKAVFDSKTMCLISLTDKETGRPLISEPSAYFRYVEENPRYGMTSWRVGPYGKVVNLNAENGVRLTESILDPICSRLSYELTFGASLLRATVMLKEDSRVLEYDLTVDWNEAAEQGVKIPQLSFAVPVSYRTNGKSLCDIPYGTIERETLAHDIPSLSYLGIGGEERNCIGLVSDSKYGYRLWENCGSVTLIRSAYDPDPYPERGIHTIRLGVMTAPLSDMKKEAQLFNHPIPFVAGVGRKGTLPLRGSFLTTEGQVKISCVKNAEDGSGTVVRLYDESGSEQRVTLRFSKAVREAFLTDSNETPIAAASPEEGGVVLTVKPLSVVTVLVRF